MAPIPTIPDSLLHLTTRQPHPSFSSPSSLSLSLAFLKPRIPPLLQTRQTQSNPAIIPTTYGSINSGPSPGTVVGIVLGSVGGFLLLLWLFYSCFTVGQTDDRSDVTEEVVAVKKKKRNSRSSAHSRRETVEIRRGPSPVRVVRPPTVVVPERVDRVVVEERREVRRDAPVFEGDDEIVVIEDHDPPRKNSKKKRRSSREEGGYRTVDPANYGGVVGGRRR